VGEEAEVVTGDLLDHVKVMLSKEELVASIFYGDHAFYIS